MSIRFLYFDLGRVLLDFTHERGFEQIANVASLTADEVRNALMTSGLSDRYEVGEISTAEFHQHFCEITGASISVEQLTLAWSDIFSLIPGTVRIAAGLRSANYPVGILSNTCVAHWEFAAKRFCVLSQIFEPVITSYDAKSMKPDSGIYVTAAESAKCEPGEIFFVDDRQENVEGARSRGWQAVQFRSPKQLADDLETLGVIFNR